HGVYRESRNGPVIAIPRPVTTVYENPMQRLTFWPERDVNVAFLVAEALWMLAGRYDLTLPKRYISTFDQFSDDQLTLHGAYGYRWKYAFGINQLAKIADALRSNSDDRRAVLQMWDARLDLGVSSKDIPCNDTATFQINVDGELDLTVFCRSNDIVWGC